jgi:3-oxoacyl-[acyl-carrier-protein] synthase-1/3-oxoacyl-[acyl-carrier-protein] synthase II
MALGEAAVLFALVREASAQTRPLGYLRGFGASCDAVHVTAPDRTGAGLARAARQALADAAVSASAVELVSAHATATPFNDAAEARALADVLGGHAPAVPVHPFKAVVGHTLGASAALETAAALDAMSRALLPAAGGAGEPDPDAAVKLLQQNSEGSARLCLKLSAAFGGANAALVASTESGVGRPVQRRGARVAAIGAARTAADVHSLDTRMPETTLSRLDPLSAAAVAAAASAIHLAPDIPRERTAVVVGTIAATIENDEAFDARLRERGAKGAEPRRFPPTSPNLPAGQCGIAFGLLGPSLSVGAGPEAPLEALWVATNLVEAGDADAAVVVAAEHVGPVVREIFRAAAWPCPEDGALAVVLLPGSDGDTGAWRDGLSRALHEARSRGGTVGEAAAGWPALRLAAHALRGPQA